MDFAWGTLVQFVYFPSRQYHGPMKKTRKFFSWIFNFIFLKVEPCDCFILYSKIQNYQKEKRKKEGKWQLALFPTFSTHFSFKYLSAWLVWQWVRRTSLLHFTCWIHNLLRRVWHFNVQKLWTQCVFGRHRPTLDC